jgi:hypothetical protein
MKRAVKRKIVSLPDCIGKDSSSKDEMITQIKEEFYRKKE